MDHPLALALSTLLFLAAPALAQDAQPSLGPQSHPRDQPTTDPLPSGGGPSGAAPSDELERGRAQLERETVAPPRLTTAEAHPLIGRAVALPDGQTVGQVADFVLGGPDGRIVQAVVSTGGVLGVGGRMVAVPAETLRFHPGERMVVLAMPQAQFNQAPEFQYTPTIQTLVGPKPSPRG